MNSPTTDIAFTEAVKAVQARYRSRARYARVEAEGGFRKEITQDLAEFIKERDSLYLATANKDGQPYIQHRGGPKGFITVLDDRTLGFADYAGNKQYITVGTLSENDKAFIFLMDYPNRRRIKIWGKAKVIDSDPEILAKLKDPAYQAKVERAIVFEIEAWDINCPQHIRPRYTDDEIALVVDQFKVRIIELETENKRLKEGLVSH